MKIMQVRIKPQIKIGLYSCCYLFAYFLYAILEVLKYSRYVSVFPNYFFKVGNYVVLVFLILTVCTLKKIRIKEIVLIITILASGALAAWFSKDGLSLILLLLFVALAKSIEIDKILKVDFWAMMLGWGFVTISCLLGIIENRQYGHQGMVANTVGFNYFSYPTKLLFSSSVIYLIVRNKKTSYIELLLIATINIWAYRIYTTRAYLYAILAYEMWFLITTKLDVLKVKARIWDVIASIGYFLAEIGTLIVFAAYDPQNNNWAKINRFFSNRLAQGKRGLNVYGLTLLGQEVIMSGNAERVYGNVRTEYDFIDSGFLHTSLAYGMIFAIIILLCYTVVFKYSYSKNKRLLYGWIGLFMIMNVFDNHMLSIVVNPTLLLLFPVISELKNQEKFKFILKR